MIAAGVAVAGDVVMAVVESVATRGYAVMPAFLAPDVVHGLRSNAGELDRAGALRPAGVGRGAARAERPDIRGDRIGWLGEEARSPAERALRDTLEELRIAANRALQLGLFEFEGHYAVYPPGAGYERHLDRFHDDDARVLSLVLYLNEGWRAADGGALRLHVGECATIDVIPAGGTLVAFLADRFPHEVLPATRSRLSVAGWFRRRR